MRDLDESAKRLMQTHPEQAEQIYEHQRQINEQWNTLTARVSNSLFNKHMLFNIPKNHLKRQTKHLTVENIWIKKKLLVSQNKKLKLKYFVHSVKRRCCMDEILATEH